MTRSAGFELVCFLVCGMLLADHGRVRAQVREPSTTLASAQGPPPLNPLLAGIPILAEPTLLQGLPPPALFPTFAEPTPVQGPPPLDPPPAQYVPVAEPPLVPPERSRPSPFPTSLGAGIGGGVGMTGYGGFAPGQLGGSGAFGGPGFLAPRISYAAAWYPSQPTSQNTGLGLERQDLAFTLPVWHEGPNTVMVTSNVRSVLYQTNAILPNSGQPFPTDLWNIGAGINYMRQFQNGWTMTTMVNVSSSSDQPFAAWRDLNVSLGGFVRIPSGERNAWMLGAMYSPTGEVPFPMPIASYYWQPSDQFSMNIGMPFSMRWRPLEDLQFDVSYVPVRTVHSRITYRVAPGVGIYTGFDWNNESYFLADRTTINERFFYYEKRLTLGCRCTVSARSAFDLSGGYAFDRFFFTGEQFSDQNHDRVDVGNGPFLSMRFQYRF